MNFVGFLTKNNQTYRIYVAFLFFFTYVQNNKRYDMLIMKHQRFFLKPFFMLSQKDHEYKNYVCGTSFTLSCLTRKHESASPPNKLFLEVHFSFVAVSNFKRGQLQKGTKGPTIKALTQLQLPVRGCESETRKQNMVQEKTGRFSDGHVHVYVSLSL